MSKKNIQSFNLIFIRPVGAIGRMDKKAWKDRRQPAFGAANYRVLNRAWRLTDRDNGIIFFEVPDEFSTTQIFLSWLGRLEKAGIVFDFDHGNRNDLHEKVMKVVKGPTSPYDLPE